tara:strand:- start:352 stop:546 length:195 start_codon:yes stop_codon:yes gene_type:complete
MLCMFKEASIILNKEANAIDGRSGWNCEYPRRFNAVQPDTAEEDKAFGSGVHNCSSKNGERSLD